MSVHHLLTHGIASQNMQENGISANNTTNKCLDVCHAGVISASSSVLSLPNEILCRICHGHEKTEELFSYCNCKGSVGLSHKSCLLHWIKMSGSVTCELCKQRYVTIGRVNRRFWQWKLPRIGTKGWFKLVFFAGFLSMLVAFTTWIIWSRTSSSLAAKRERNKKQVEYSYFVYGMLVLIAIIGMYALNGRPFLRFLGKCLVINQSIIVIPNGELCDEKASDTITISMDELDKVKTVHSRTNCSSKHEVPSLKETYVQVHMVDPMKYGVRGYAKLAPGDDPVMV
ncbi:E3 ubiquitin-protein ligase MARCH9-like [Dendronephthya gigantea]|uniref:E3 ubiquitin-protein ligase MARCH9-like n=1 Tax=Dendronephthya gigantea TaxID=151771 RepID=UPI00106C3B4B|nr:E3 ubiquitin-protein ligase MARCH9-like [Dendronephthya gigantea]